jgi:hypothetical protein
MPRQRDGQACFYGGRQPLQKGVGPLPLGRRGIRTKKSDCRQLPQLLRLDHERPGRRTS